MTASPASRKSAERQRRKDAGEVRIEVWLDRDAQKDLVAIQFNGYALSQSEAVAYALRCAQP